VREKQGIYLQFSLVEYIITPALGRSDGEPYSADIAPAPYGDGVVDMLDLALFAENWLAGTE